MGDWGHEGEGVDASRRSPSPRRRRRRPDLPPAEDPRFEPPYAWSTDLVVAGVASGGGAAAGRGAAAGYERRAADAWDRFYGRHGERFFKDRHYLEREFGNRLAAAAAVLEVGCGAGNTAAPLLDAPGRKTVYACDYAPKAVELARERGRGAGGSAALVAFVCDVTRRRVCVPEGPVPVGGVDCATLIFVLSAMDPATMPAAVRNVAEALRPGGAALVRDYAVGDLAADRLEEKGAGRRLGEHFYVRADGTRCYYFQQHVLVKLFEDAGFACEDCHVHERVVENNATHARMYRRWVQAVFVKTGRE